MLAPAVWVALHVAISSANPSLPRAEVRELARLDVKAAQAFDVSPLLLAALVEDESRWHAEVDGRGYVGLGQIALTNYPMHGPRVRARLLIPAWNLHESARTLAAWRRTCGSDPTRYVGAYQGAGCQPSPATTKILARWAELEIVAGWRRLEPREVTRAMVRHADAILTSSKPLGSVVRFDVAGRQLAGLIELHGPRPHRGVSLLARPKEHHHG